MRELNAYVCVRISGVYDHCQATLCNDHKLLVYMCMYVCVYVCVCVCVCVLFLKCVHVRDCQLIVQ